MSKVKKVFEPILAILTAAVAANPKVRVSDILDEVTAATAAKTGEGSGGKATTFHKTEEGVVDGIRCYYFGKWFDPATVEVGKKANTPSGYNSMCKVGLNQWTKQERDAKLAKDKLLADVAAGTVAASDVGAQLQAIDDAKKTVIETDLPLFDSYEELAASRTAQ